MPSRPAAALLPPELTLLLRQSLPQTLSELEEQVAMITRARADLEAEAKRLQAAEDPALGVFYAEQIHEARQNRAMLSTQLEYRQLRLKRLQDQGLAQDQNQGQDQS